MEHEPWRSGSLLGTATSTSELANICKEHMDGNGLPHHEELIADGAIHRYAARGRGNKDEWYVIHIFAGHRGKAFFICSYGSWRTDQSHTFKSWSDDNELDDQEREHLKVCMEQQREACRLALLERHREAALEAQQIWDNAATEPPSEEYIRYAQLKQIAPIGARFGNNQQGYPSIILPIRDAEGVMHSLQFISRNSSQHKTYKSFLTGGKKQGNFLPLELLSCDTKYAFIVEGWATGVSVYNAGDQKTLVIVAFDAGNIDPVIGHLRKKFPLCTFTLAGDNDDAGRKVAQDIYPYGCKAIFPTFPTNMQADDTGKCYTDFNDLQVVCGKDEVYRQLHIAIHEVRAASVDDTPQDPCADFDINIFPPIVVEYIQIITKTTNAHPIAILCSFLTAVAGAMKNKVYIKEYFQDLYPTLWTLIISASGQFKTTALNKGAKIAYEISEQIEREVIKLKNKLAEAEDDGQRRSIEKEIARVEAQDPLLPNKVTLEALLATLARNPGGAIFASEFAAWLQSLEPTYNAGLKKALTELFDAPPIYRYTTKTQGDYTLRHPCVSIHGVSTMTWLKSHMKLDDVFSGFFARVLSIAPVYRADIPPSLPMRIPPELQERQNSIEQELLVRLKDLKPGHYTLSEAARAAFDKEHHKIYDQFNSYDAKFKEILDPYVKRWSPYILKLAMIIRFLEDSQSLELSETSIHAAAAFVHVAIKSTMNMLKGEFAESEFQLSCRKVYEAIQKKDREAGAGIQRRKILGSKILGGGAKEYDPVFSFLIESGQIEEKRVEKKSDWLYTLRKD